MKKWISFLLAALLLTGCASTAGTAETTAAPTAQPETTTAAESSDQLAGPGETIAAVEVVEEGMEPIYGSSILDGEYDVTVDSSSSMFNIVSCRLTVENGQMTAVMTMSGTGYLKLYMGTGEEALEADEADFIPYVEDASGAHTYTVPVEALDAGIACAAYSKNKEKWYDRTLVFRADSLPASAFAEGVITTAEDLELADGLYLVDVTLSGGSGKASVLSPTQIEVADGQVTATIIFSSSNYDYMLVDDVRYDYVSLEEGSTFQIPVQGFDWQMPVVADTVAMSTPHEISYTLCFDSASITPVTE